MVSHGGRKRPGSSASPGCPHAPAAQCLGLRHPGDVGTPQPDFPILLQSNPTIDTSGDDLGQRFTSSAIFVYTEEGISAVEANLCLDLSNVMVNGDGDGI